MNEHLQNENGMNAENVVVMEQSIEQREREKFKK